jgi:tripartite-type tricarboxylate transporter receptor subunit TctC
MSAGRQVNMRVETRVVLANFATTLTPTPVPLPVPVRTPTLAGAGTGVGVRAGAMRRRTWLLACCAAPAIGGARAAPPWPSRTLRLIVAYAPGGVSDEITRLLAQHLGARLGVPAIVDNRAGAGGSLAMGLLARAPADGHTLCFSAVTPLTLLPLLGRVGYDPVAGIAPVAAVMTTPVLVVGTPALGARSLSQALARTGPLRWATSGVGTTGHLVLEQVRRDSGAAITHVPYKGGGLQLHDALGGQFELLSTNVGAQQLRHVQDDRLQALAVGAPARLPLLPQVPTLAEAGHPQANWSSLFGLFAPGATPPPLRARINAEVNAVLALADVRARLLAVNNLPLQESADAFAQRIALEAAAHRRLMAHTPAR